jgi:hypothetical protein
MAGVLRNPRYRYNGQPSNNSPVGYARNRIASRDMLFGGNGQFGNPVNDPITLDNAPYRAKLRVFDERTGILAREAWSNADGTWTIAWLNRSREYLVVCYDATYPALAYDHQTPDPMP